MNERIYPEICYGLTLPHWLTCEQAAQQFGNLNGCARVLLQDLAAACVIRRQWCYGAWYYSRDDVELVAATLARRPLVDALRYSRKER
jgi:hypothetical protein